ncbi:MAG: DUF1015 domain-containing protein [Clostridiales bacterium]|jgi:uncharacterized protein (DUF1015 family)|nr:DUF1015 domain-containing protein [Clostridiales bacterium]
MAKIVPIRGVRYNPDKAGNMPDLITPPYDVINEEAQIGFYEKSPYNIIRLEYGRIRDNDDANDNRYTRSAAFFSNWLQQNILIHDQKPSIYLYEQEFTVEDQRLTRSGIICGVGVEDYSSGTILPHEETLSKAKADRLELLRHCGANFSPIFGLYDDPSLSVETIATGYKNREPDVAFTAENGEAHRLWLLSDEGDLSCITALFDSKKIYIADGHHRYETALNYHKEMQAQGRNEFGFTLMTLVNLHDPGLIILPTHRLVKNIHNFSPQQFLDKVAQNFTVLSATFPSNDRATALSVELASMKEAMASANAFSVYLGDNILYRLSIPRGVENRLMASRCGAYSAQWRELDVAILQCLVLEEALGIDKEARHSGTNLTYTREEAKALESVDAGEYQAAIFLNPTLVKEVTEVAAAGDKMPQKSTYFYPKLITGLIINDFSK